MAKSTDRQVSHCTFTTPQTTQTRVSDTAEMYTYSTCMYFDVPERGMEDHHDSRHCGLPQFVAGEQEKLDQPLTIPVLILKVLSSGVAQHTCLHRAGQRQREGDRDGGHSTGMARGITAPGA